MAEIYFKIVIKLYLCVKMLIECNFGVEKTNQMMLFYM